MLIVMFENHQKENKEKKCNADCSICNEANIHREDARVAREEYINDKK